MKFNDKGLINVAIAMGIIIGAILLGNAVFTLFFGRPISSLPPMIQSGIHLIALVLILFFLKVVLVRR